MGSYQSHSDVGYVSDWYTDVKQLLKHAKPGDAIEIDRLIYLHWGIYVGKVEIDGLRKECIVHASNFPDENIAHLVFQSQEEHSQVGIVQCEPIEDVLQGYRARVNNSMDLIVEPHEPKIIVKRAFAAVAEYDEYHLLSNNCEHFAHWCRNGVKKSSQVEDFFSNSNSINRSGLGIVISLFLNAQIPFIK